MVSMMAWPNQLIPAMVTVPTALEPVTITWIISASATLFGCVVAEVGSEETAVVLSSTVGVAGSVTWVGLLPTTQRPNHQAQVSGYKSCSSLAISTTLFNR